MALFLSLFPDTEEIFTAISNACFCFLPIFVAYSSACHFDTHRLLAMASTSSLLLPRVPSGIFQDFFVPAITIILTALIGIITVGPLGSILGPVISSLITMLQNINPLLSWAVFATLTPLLLITGTHWIFAPMILESLSNTGIDIGYMVGFLICNASLIGKCFAIYLCEHRSSDQSATLSAALIILFAGVLEDYIRGFSHQSAPCIRLLHCRYCSCFISLDIQPTYCIQSFQQELDL